MTGVSGEGLCPRCLFSLAVRSTPQPIPARIGPYEILGVLGEGGMGTVYRALDPDLSRELAIKVLPDQVASSAHLARFEREARLLAALNHPNIATLHGMGETDGRPYLILELIEGEPLSHRLSRGPVPVAEAMDIARQVADALEVAHEAGIVHRDLKPGNVMLGRRGLVKVLDFGIAKASDKGPVPADKDKLTGAGALVGTIPYMSPEQIRGEAVDERTDLWGLGCLLFEVLTARTPFQRSTPALTLVAIHEEEPDLDTLPGSTPEGIRMLLERCFRKDVSERLATAREARLLVREAQAQIEGRYGGAAGDRSRARHLAWAAGGVLTTAAVLTLAEGSLVRTVVRVLPEGLRLATSDGGPLAAVSIVAVGLAAAVLQALRAAPQPKRSRLVRRTATGASVLVGLVLLYLAGDWITARAQSVGSGALDVYVVLPFAGYDDEETGELRMISEQYRSTLETVLGGLESVRVLPPAYPEDILRTAPPQCTWPRVELWTRGSELSPDLVLCSTVNLFQDGEGGRGLTVVSGLRRVHHGELELMSSFDSRGKDTEVRWLALSATLELVRSLEGDPLFGLTDADEAEVMERILEQFSEFLTHQGDTGAEAARVVDELRTAGAVDGPGVRAVLAAYESPVSLEAEAARLERIRDALLRRVGRSP